MRKSTKIWSIVGLIALVSLIGLFIAGKMLIEWGEEDFKRGQNLTLNDLEFALVVTDRHGEEIYRNFETENREWVNLEDIPESLQVATVIAEDKRFFFHRGVDIKGIIRAFWINHQAGRIVQGGSTLSQQIARKIYLTDERTYERKLREIFIALGIESKFSKSEILEMYLNTAPYGARLNGVSVAAKAYFDKPVSQLTPAESLTLAMLPKDPVRLSRTQEVKNWLGSCPIDFVDDSCSPFRDLNYDFSRVESLLFAMAKRQAWSNQQLKKTWQDLKTLKINNAHRWVDDDFQHWRFYVEDFLKQHDFDFAQAETGLVIKTTLDAALQKKIYRQLRLESGELFEKHWIENFATLILDHESRGPLVWIGSKYFWNQSISGQVDILRSSRQTGSTIKPFIYAAAIEAGFQPPTIFYDSAIQFRGDQHFLRNSDGRFRGGIRMSRALASSRNIPAAKALLLAGGERTVRKWLDEHFGFDINKNFGRHFFGWTLALGTAPIEMSKLANAYATLGSGKHQPICPIVSITTLDGKNLYHPCQVKIARNFNKTTGFLVSDILSNKSVRPDDWSRLVTPKLPVAIKTGTSSKRVNGKLSPVDDIIVGYSPQATILLWSGNTDGKALKPGSVAVYAVGKTWRNIANTFFDQYPRKFSTFQAPESMQRINGEWATLDYQHPGYQSLSRFVTRNVERGLNPLYQLDHER